MSTQQSKKSNAFQEDDAALTKERWRERLLIKPLKNYAVSDHYNGQRFHNLERNPRDRNALFSWLLTRRPAQWPAWVENENFPVPPQRLSNDSAEWRVTFINHATVLVQIGPYNVLTDPVWSNRVSPFLRMGPKRVRQAGVSLADLPPIDIILLSHNHYDHMDLATLRVIEKRDKPLVVTGLGNASLLRANGLQTISELDWWESVSFQSLTIHFTPAQHFSGRSMRDRNASLWGSFWVDTPKGALYFAGDTGYGKHFVETRKRLGRPRLALLPIGAYLPRTIMQPVHMNPEEAVRAHRDLQAAQSLGIHFNTFQLTDEAIDKPVDDLRFALQQHHIEPATFWVLKEGEGRDVPASHGDRN
jgi:L-ascorbate metabolism protein UlaG (beta-lactamase superfamily)